MASCRGCGNELARDANFCPVCGLRTEKGERDGVRTPITPRPDWEKDLEAALNNATRLMDDAFQAARSGLQAVADEVGVEIERARGQATRDLAPVYCPKCGNRNPGDSIYCTTCGKELRR
jgi:rRNA maturation endonuclease Nob1